MIAPNYTCDNKPERPRINLKRTPTSAIRRRILQNRLRSVDPKRRYLSFRRKKTYIKPRPAPDSQINLTKVLSKPVPGPSEASLLPGKAGLKKWKLLGAGFGIGVLTHMFLGNNSGSGNKKSNGLDGAPKKTKSKSKSRSKKKGTRKKSSGTSGKRKVPTVKL